MLRKPAQGNINNHSHPQKHRHWHLWVKGESTWLIFQIFGDHTISASAVNQLKNMLSEQRNTDEIITVQSILFIEEEYIWFMETHNFCQITARLLSSQLNGEAEGDVRSCKALSETDQCKFWYRVTPICKSDSDPNSADVRINVDRSNAEMTELNREILADKRYLDCPFNQKESFT